MSYEIKKNISNICKNIIITDDIEGVSVTKIMRIADMRRQSFYDYFLDKYDVIEWTFHDDLDTMIHDHTTYANWSNLVLDLCCYFYDNQKFYRRIFSHHCSINALAEKIIKENIQRLIQLILKDMLQTEHIFFDNGYTQFVTNIFTQAIFGEIETWINQLVPLQPDTEAHYMITFIQDTMIGAQNRIVY